MTRVVFEEISIKGFRRWKDPVTGKSRQETKKFCQTRNPYNKNTAGAPKSYAEILDEVRAERDAWLKTGEA